MEIRPTATKTPKAEANIILKNCFISVLRNFYQTANIVNLLILIVLCTRLFGLIIISFIKDSSRCSGNINGTNEFLIMKLQILEYRDLEFLFWYFCKRYLISIYFWFKMNKEWLSNEYMFKTKNYLYWVEMFLIEDNEIPVCSLFSITHVHYITMPLVEK